MGLSENPQAILESEWSPDRAWKIVDRELSFTVRVRNGPWWDLTGMRDVLEVLLNNETLSLHRDGPNAMVGQFKDGTMVEYSRNRLGTPNPYLAPFYAGRIRVGEIILYWRPDAVLDRTYVGVVDQEPFAIIRPVEIGLKTAEWLDPDLPIPIRVTTLVTPFVIGYVATIPRSD